MYLRSVSQLISSRPLVPNLVMRWVPKNSGKAPVHGRSAVSLLLCSSSPFSTSSDFPSPRPPAPSLIRGRASTCTPSTALTTLRQFHASPARRGLEEFFENQQPGTVGRPWRVNELRLKSFEDLQKLWFVLVKERNMLHTYKHDCIIKKAKMANPDRLKKVKTTMQRIQQVIGERNREYKTQTGNTQWIQENAVKTERRARVRAKIRQVKKANTHRTTPKWLLKHKARKKYLFKGLKPRFPEPELIDEGVGNEAGDSQSKESAGL